MRGRGRLIARGRDFGQGRYASVEPESAVSAPSRSDIEPQQPAQPSQLPESWLDWEQAMRLIACEGLTQEAIEATIQAARWTMGTHAAYLASEGFGIATTGTTNGHHLGVVVVPYQDISGSYDTEEHRK